MTKHLHETLRLSFQELGALLGTRELLKRAALRPVKGGSYDPGDHVFDMEVTCRKNGECGSIACIGGTMGQIMGLKDVSEYVYDKSTRLGLGELFFPRDLPENFYWAQITPAQGVKAIDNFLRYGKPKWPKVIGLDKPVAKAKKAQAKKAQAKKPAKRARY